MCIYMRIYIIIEDTFYIYLSLKKLWRVLLQGQCTKERLQKLLAAFAEDRCKRGAKRHKSFLGDSGGICASCYPDGGEK